MAGSIAPGTRVSAVRNFDDSTIYLFGHGVYVGDRPPPGAVERVLESARAQQRRRDETDPTVFLVPMVDRQVSNGLIDAADRDARLAEMLEAAYAERARPFEERALELAEKRVAAPLIELDGGGVVWAFQCVWFPEDQFEKVIGDRAVVAVPLPPG